MIKILVESNSSKVFDLNNPGSYVEEYMDWYKVGKVSGHDYKKFEKKRDSRITYMTCDDYIDNCINGVFNNDYDAVVTHAVDFDKVHRYSEAMRNGDTFPVPYLDYDWHQQEGRHRAFAYADAFGENAKFPVLEVFPVEPEDVTNDEIYAYVKQKMGNYNPDGMFDYVATIHGRTEEEICGYLGKPYEPEYGEIDEDELDAAILDDIEAELFQDDVNDNINHTDYNDEIRKLSQRSGKSIQEIESLNPIQFMKLVDIYL